MYSSVLAGMEASPLYQQTPAILLGLLLVLSGGTLLAIGLGAAGEVRSRFGTWLGVALLAGAVMMREIEPATATTVLFSLAVAITITMPIALTYLGVRVYRLGS